MSDISRRIAKLSPEKRALFDLQLMENKTLIAKEQGIPRRAASDYYPLSFAQQRLWLLEKFEPDDFVYNIPIAIQLIGILNVVALEQSLNKIVKRHEVLRTIFSIVQEEPVQIIIPNLHIELPLKDLQHLSETQRTAELQH